MPFNKDFRERTLGTKHSYAPARRLPTRTLENESIGAEHSRTPTKCFSTRTLENEPFGSECSRALAICLLARIFLLVLNNVAWQDFTSSMLLTW